MLFSWSAFSLKNLSTFSWSFTILWVIICLCSTSELSRDCRDDSRLEADCGSRGLRPLFSVIADPAESGLGPCALFAGCDCLISGRPFPSSEAFPPASLLFASKLAFRFWGFSLVNLLRKSMVSLAFASSSVNLRTCSFSSSI